VPLAADEVVLILTGAANRDPNAFADADRFGPAAKWRETIGGRELAIAMIRGPGGEPVELLELPRK
jgi:cytochrome P450